MPVNRNALIRYRTLDKCLQNHYRKWTIDDLVEACSDALYEYEGIDSGVSLRTVQGDLQMMRSDKLGYNAPIVVKERKYYTYEEPNYSITNIPLTDQDLGKLTEAVEFMKQFQGFSHFQELDGMVQKLEDHIYSQRTKQKPVVEMEKNENLKGLQHLDVLYKAIVKKRTLEITYQSFKARQSNSFLFHAYLLKEYRNRWFLVGREPKKTNILFLALDRMEKLDYSDEPYWEADDFDSETYFKHAIGVSVAPTMKVEEVKLWVSQVHAPYVITKPLHPSQKVVERDNYGTVISLQLQHNFELEKEILAFGDGMKVIAPERLKRQVNNRVRAALDLYETELSGSNLVALKRQLEHKGYGILNQVFTRKDLSQITTALDKARLYDTPESIIPQLLERVPLLEAALDTRNYQDIVSAIGKDKTCIHAFYINNSSQQEEGVSWEQKGLLPQLSLSEEQIENAFTLRIHLTPSNEHTGGMMTALPGSHKKVHSAQEIEFMASNTLGTPCPVSKGGIVVYKPLLLISQKGAKGQKKNRTLEFWYA